MRNLFVRSECLSCAPVLWKYLRDVVAVEPRRGQFADAIRSFALAGDVLEILTAGARQGSPDDLDRATIE